MGTLFSVVINTRNEIRHIAGCMASVRSFADEIVVCDMRSTDGTAACAAALGARVIDHPVCAFVEPARYAAITAARGDWVLVIDADERLTPRLAARLRQVAADGRHRAVSIAFLTQFAGHWLRHGPTGHLRVVRFFRRQVYCDHFRPQELQLHENFKSLRALPDLLQLDLSTPMLHLAYPSLGGLILKQIRYAWEDAQKRREKNESAAWSRLFRRVTDRARKAVIGQQAWRDGLPGLLFSAVMCLHEWVSALELRALSPGADQAAELPVAAAAPAAVVLPGPVALPLPTAGTCLQSQSTG